MTKGYKKLLLTTLVMGIFILVSLWGFLLIDKGYIKQEKKIESIYFDQFANTNLLLFFGYVGCVDVCTPRLSELAKIFTVLVQKKTDVKVLFINLLPALDIKATDSFAKIFSSAVSGHRYT